MDVKTLINDFATERSKTEALCQPLAIEDYVIQSSEDVSPPKWHLAHTTWFFETFILKPYKPNYVLFNPLFQYLFNSYYQSLGPSAPRKHRGLLSRPTVETVLSYRKDINRLISELIHETKQFETIAPLCILGLHHEQQHQELLLMDIKYNFSHDPSFPIYKQSSIPFTKPLAAPLKFNVMEGGMINQGFEGPGFCFDNELPRHPVYLTPYSLANRLVTNGEYLEFIEAGGYHNPAYWLSDGWDLIQKNHWQAPLYWYQQDNQWQIYTLSGLQKLDPEEPVAHVSFYEADAYARFKGCRLPTEAEWENYVTVQNLHPNQGHFLETDTFHPQAAAASPQCFGDVWEWTASAYAPYPGFKPLCGALGEYNGKFMSNQMVLRGGSCLTPSSHMRLSYRNFFAPDKRWQMSGIRLAK